jgi:DNA polymerase-3 subunit alpha
MACIINDVEHRVAKNGNPFGIFNLEDYDGTYRMFMFKDEYLKFKHYLVNGNFIHVRGRINEKRWGDHAPVFNINSMELLTEIRDKLSKSITLTIPIRKVTNEFVDSILELVEGEAEDEKGNCKLKVIVTDEEKTEINLFSRKLKVKVTNDFLSELDEMEGVRYKLN